MNNQKVVSIFFSGYDTDSPDIMFDWLDEHGYCENVDYYVTTHHSTHISEYRFSFISEEPALQFKMVMYDYFTVG